MVKTVKHPTTRTPAPTVRSFVARSFVARVRSWTPQIAKVLAVLLSWVAAWYALFETTPTEQVAQIAAVGFWFGWLFVFVTLVFFAGVLVTGVIRDVRKPILA
jgi:thiosulfate reductase cytochrome b subunit